MLDAELSNLQDERLLSRCRIILYSLKVTSQWQMKAITYRDKNLIGLCESLLSSMALNSLVRREYTVDLPSVGSLAGLVSGPIELSA